jgi:hypothetical protein
MENDEEAPAPARNRGWFKKGTSGNPRGRPKKQRSSEKLDLELLDVLNAPILAQIGGKQQKITRARAIGETLVDMALKRDPKAIALLTSVLKHQKLIDPAAPETQYGVLVVPGMAQNPDEWERRVAENQARYRVNRGEDTDDS